jgi:hypothetical protein
MSSSFTPSGAERYEIRFQSLFHTGRAVSFPCDRQGRVQVEGLSDRARKCYEQARSRVGSEYATPAIVPSDLH